MNKMIPSEIIHADENGDAVIGKNLKIKGTAKLSGGLDSIHQYSFTDNEETIWHLHDYGSFSSTGNSLISLNDEDGNYYIYGIGYYDISTQEITYVEILGYNTYDQCYEDIYYDGQKITVRAVAYDENTQPKLYRHKLTINNLYILMYNSTSKLKVNSVDILRIIMKISVSHEEILPVCASDATAIATLVVTDSLCQVNGVDVTAVSDVVTEL